MRRGAGPGRRRAPALRGFGGAGTGMEERAGREVRRMGAETARGVPSGEEREAA